MKIMSQTKARKDFFKIAKEVNEDSVSASTRCNAPTPSSNLSTPTRLTA